MILRRIRCALLGHHWRVRMRWDRYNWFVVCERCGANDAWEMP